MKRCGWIYYLLLVLLTYSCSQISESERFIAVEPATVKRAVLIEEFTGQRCVNCPNAATEIARIQQSYGENVIAVAIHSGPLAIFSRDQVTGLRTELGDTYYNYWGVEEEPSALINRKGGVVRLNQWQTMIHDQLQLQTPLSLKVTCQTRTAGGIDIQVSIHSSVIYRGKLQLWLTEDQVVAPQLMTDGTMNAEYVHQHVLRTAVNGDWGDDIELEAGETKDVHFEVTPSLDLNIAQVSVVAFVYSQTGVDQVTSCRVLE
jgi:hypothetical protein